MDETELFSDQDLFIDWSVVNTSLVTGITAPFQTHLFVDGISLFFWTHEPLPPDTFHRIFDKNIGKLSAGDHTLRILTDVTFLVDESDENDNQYQKVITVKARSGQTLALQSSATVQGPYEIDATASIDTATQTVRLPLPLVSRYFRLIGPNAVRITSIRVVGAQLELSFETI